MRVRRATTTRLLLYRLYCLITGLIVVGLLGVSVVALLDDRSSYRVYSMTLGKGSIDFVADYGGWRVCIKESPSIPITGPRLDLVLPLSTRVVIRARPVYLFVYTESMNVPLWSFLIICAAVIPLIVHRMYYSTLRRCGCVCSGCGYLLRGNVSGICPECGATAHGGRLNNVRKTADSHRDVRD